MEKCVLLISRDSETPSQLHQRLAANHYATHAIQATSQIDTALETMPCHCMIIDLDSIAIDNRTIRELTMRHPRVYLLCISQHRFHPDLKDAIRNHIYACLTKPLDYDELLYWLKCIDVELDSGTPTTHKNH